ncbi:MAG: SMI1/KNR4 family protein [Cytophagaceae bacterium]
MTYRSLTDIEKESYRQKLKRDTQKPFDSEFVRTTDLENSLIVAHGMDGVRLIFEDQNSVAYTELGRFPSDCPWFKWNLSSIPDFIDTNFKPLAPNIPELLASMKERCRFIYAEKSGSSWKLHYLMDVKLYDGRDYYRIYTGGMPNPDPQPNESLKAFGWKIPADLKKFYAVHDGFGEENNTHSILSSERISIMAGMMDSICAEQNAYPEGYAYKDLLEFFPDGAGNAQCFYRTDSDGSVSGTVDWDHEVWEISEEENFFDFIDERMSSMDEE